MGLTVAWAAAVWLITRKLRDDLALLGLAAVAAVVSGIAYLAFSAVMMA